MDNGMRTKWEMKSFPWQSVMEPREKLETSISSTLQTHEEPFKQVSPNFFMIYFILWLQRQIHMKHRCKYMSHPRFSSTILIAFSRFLSFSLSSARCFRKISSEHTWRLYQWVIVRMITWSYRLNSLDNIYLADSVLSRCSSANALSSRRARNFINVFLYFLHEAIFARRQTIVDTIVCQFTSVTRSTRYPVIHWTFCRIYRRSLFRISQTQIALDQFC